jgi:hypothetical protein
MTQIQRPSTDIGIADLKQLFEEVFAFFLRKDRKTIVNDAHERSLCTRLAIYLECFKGKYNLDDYYADTEYNRNRDRKIKTILDHKAMIIPITCDLILHSRGEIVARDNLIAIEMKKASHSQAVKNSDRKRLRALTKASYDDVWSADGETFPEHVCGYALGFLVVLDVFRATFTVEEYRSGERIGSWQGEF